MTNSYQIAASEVISESLVTRSRFICYISPCQNNEQAKKFIASLREIHPQASHYCYGFITGAPNDSQGYGFSDDGEPSGTAGKPIFTVLQGSNIGEICAVVVRYFGGTKLGTGGLQRAYGASVRQAITELKVSTKIAMAYKSLACQYNQVNDVQHFVEQFAGKIIAKNFAEQVILTIAIPLQNKETLQEQLLLMSAGKIILKKAPNNAVNIK